MAGLCGRAEEGQSLCGLLAALFRKEVKRLSMIYVYIGTVPNSQAVRILHARRYHVNKLRFKNTVTWSAFLPDVILLVAIRVVGSSLVEE